MTLSLQHRFPGRPAAGLICALLLLGGLVACREAPVGPASDLPNIVLVSLDTLNVHHTGIYNPAVDFSPTLDALAASGVVFEYAFAPAGLTLPSHTSIFTGNTPATTKVLANGNVLSENATTLAETLRDAGYRTGAFVSLGVLKANFGLAQGFDVYEDRLEQPRQRWYSTADEVVDAALPWVRENAEDPLFLWVHISDPHMPYIPKDAPPDVKLEMDGEELGSWTLGTRETFDLDLVVPPGRHELVWTRLWDRDGPHWKTPHVNLELIATPSLEAVLVSSPAEAFRLNRLSPSLAFSLDNPSDAEVAVALRFTGRESNMSRREMTRRYDTEVAYLDGHLARLREEFISNPSLADTIWVLVSDHGEGLFNRDVGGHAGWVYEDQLRIVWAMSGPGLPATVVRDTPARSEDILPTLLEVVGLEAPGPTDGRSLVQCWSGASCDPPAPWQAHNISHSDQRVVAVAVYDWPLKWLWHEKRGEEAYQMLEDPENENDLIGSAPLAKQLKELARQGSRYRAALSKQLSESSGPLDSDTTEILKNLGYM